MVVLTETSSFVPAVAGVGLVKRLTSTLTTINDPMNTAFYEPDDDEYESATNDKNGTIDEKPDYWEDRLDELTARFPLLMLVFVPLFVQILLILLLTFAVHITGIAAYSNKLAAYLYYYLFCCIF